MNSLQRGNTGVKEIAKIAWYQEGSKMRLFFPLAFEFGLSIPIFEPTFIQLGPADSQQN